MRSGPYQFTYLDQESLESRDPVIFFDLGLLIYNCWDDLGENIQGNITYVSRTIEYLHGNTS